MPNRGEQVLALYLDGQSLQEIADTTGSSYGSVRSLLCRERKKRGISPLPKKRDTIEPTRKLIPYAGHPSLDRAKSIGELANDIVGRLAE